MDNAIKNRWAGVFKVVLAVVGIAVASGFVVGIAYAQEPPPAPPEPSPRIPGYVTGGWGCWGSYPNPMIGGWHGPGVAGQGSPWPNWGPQNGHSQFQGRWGGRGMGMMPGYGYSGYTPDPAATVPPAAFEDVSFADDVQPILQSRCVACHGGVEGLYLTDYQSTLRGGTNGPVIIPSDPNGSRLIQYVGTGYMPYGGPPLTTAQFQTLVNWVAAGAPDN